MKVLVTGAGALLGQGIIRSLKRSTLDIAIATADPNVLSPGLFWTDERYLIPFADDADYVARIEHVIDQSRADALLVGTDVELPFYAAHRVELERRGIQVLVSSPDVVSIADDKYRTNQFFRNAGFDAPGSALPEDTDELERLIATSGFPLIVKPRIGARAIGVSLVRDRAELRAALTGRTGLIVQECVGSDDQEYTASVLVFDGSAKASIVMRRDLRDGNTYRAFTEPFDELNAIVRRWGEALNPYGPANFQFRIDDKGRPKAFEINGRFSGTTPLRALVGFNEVEMCLRKILLGEEIVQPAVETATILRYWSEEKVSSAQLQAL